MKKQFGPVNNQYGAPMGRLTWGLISDCDPKSVRLFKVKLDRGGYDDGGAYWGSSLSVGPLYCAMDDGAYRAFIRAYSREHARTLLKISPDYLMINTRA
jgi:hypothetical protein